MSFPYKILNDLSAKLKAAEENVEQVRKHYEAKITGIVEEYEGRLRSKFSYVHTVSDQSQQTENVKDELEIENCEKAVDDEIGCLKKKVSWLTYENNRYHLMLSNCTMCPDVSNSDDLSSFLDASTRQTLDSESSVPLFSPSTIPASAVLPGTMPPMLPITPEKKKRTVGMQKDQAYITRLVRCLSKLEKKYSTPTHKRKPRLFKRKERTNAIVPKEFSSIFDHLAQPDPNDVKQIPGTIYPEVKWNLVKFKPVLPHPESCPLYSCSQDPSFYEDNITGCLNPRFKNARIQTKFLQRNPFGSLPGFVTNLGVVAVPETPVGGYVYCPDAKRWMIHATIPSTEGGGRSSRGSLPSRARRRG